MGICGDTISAPPLGAMQHGANVTTGWMTVTITKCLQRYDLLFDVYVKWRVSNTVGYLKRQHM